MNIQGEFSEAPQQVIEAKEVPTQNPKVKKTILVVDDELSQLRSSHVRGVSPDFYTTIADITYSVYDNLRNILNSIESLEATSWDDQKALEYLNSDHAVSNVLLSTEFQTLAEKPLKDLLSSFFARAERVKKIKSIFEIAFPDAEFELFFQTSPRPSFAQISSCSAVFLDLFLEIPDKDPVETLQEYLKSLAKDAKENVLPPLILMSSHQELQDHRLEFSEKSNISAAGLMVLPKPKLIEPEFSVNGLNLTFIQLERQKEVAHSMRLFINTWLEALESAKTNSAKTLWNLDASAMQQIHLASTSEDDPYDEHLNQLLSREHLFHVEAETKVSDRIADLDNKFRAHLSANGELKNRLIAPLTDIQTARTLISHFTWLGSPLQTTFILANKKLTASQLSRNLPFGSVLCNDIVENNKKCIIHITQLCDLNGISRDKDPDRTVFFATATAKEILQTDNPDPSTSALVAKGLKLTAGTSVKEFDLHINAGDLFAISLDSFIDFANAQNLKIVGRLRSDITNQIVTATTNQMSRPATQKMVRPALIPTKIFLQSNSLTRGRISIMDGDKSKIFSLSMDKNNFSFQDNACIEIALWAAHHANTIGLALDPVALSEILSLGWPSPTDLHVGLKIRIRECDDLNKAYTAIEKGDIQGSNVQLTVVKQKSS